MAFLKENLPQLLSDMEMASNRICRTVQNLKDYTRKSSVLMEKKPVALNMAVENAVRLVETTIRKREIVLDLELAADLPLIEGDLPSVEQMVVNILLNAVQAIKHEEGRVSIVTGLTPAPHQVFVSIADNGGDRFFHRRTDFRSLYDNPAGRRRNGAGPFHHPKPGRGPWGKHCVPERK